MSRIDQLIAEMCPNGVRYEALADVVSNLDSQRRPVTRSERRSGRFPYYGANGIQDYVDDFIFDGTFLLVGEDGSVLQQDGSPVVNWASGQIWVNNHAHILAARFEAVSLRFLYFYLQTVDITPLVTGSAQPKLNQGNLNLIRVPVPPLAIQREIVRILDALEKLETELETELEAEVEARRRQYNHHRELLLTSANAPLIQLADLLREPLANGRSVPDGNGYPVLRLTALRGPVVDTGQQKFGAWLPEIGRRFRIQAGDLLVVRGNGSKSLIARACMVEQTEDVAFPDTMIRVRPNLELVSQKYLFHAWEGRVARVQLERVAKLTSGVWKVSQDDLSQVKLPIPSLAEQLKAVATLDKLNALRNELSVALPAEVAARRQQYEHYRARLLTFKELGA